MLFPAQIGHEAVLSKVTPHPACSAENEIELAVRFRDQVEAGSEISGHFIKAVFLNHPDVE